MSKASYILNLFEDFKTVETKFIEQEFSEEEVKAVCEVKGSIYI